MTDTLLTLAGAAAIVVAALALLIALAVIALRALRARAPVGEAALAELARAQADTALRIDAMRELLAGRQAELARSVNERLDSVTHHLNQSMTTTREHTMEGLQKVSERLAVI